MGNEFILYASKLQINQFYLYIQLIIVDNPKTSVYWCKK